MRKSLCAVVSLAALAVGACSTMRSDPRFQSIDWTALETQQGTSDGMSVSPEIDLFSLRIPLVIVEKERVTGNDIARRTVEHPVSPVGVTFGNSLAVDTEGNLFLDVLRLLKIDLQKDFDLRYGQYRLARAGSSFQYTQPLSLAAAVTVNEKGVTVKAGLATWGYTQDGSTYRYSSSDLLGPRYEMTAAADNVSITVSKIFATTYTVTQAAQSATFSPFYKVTKSGDAYLIDGLGDTRNSYQLYYAGDRIIFCEGEAVLKDIQIAPDGVLVDGRKVITLTE